MSSSDRGVPRGDHVPAGEQRESIEEQDANTRGQGVQARAAEEAQPESDTTPTPDISKGSDRGGNSGWGGAPSGGSVIDKRGPEKK
ncbi:MAG: hypothetical protein JWL60_2672 [Gemmatimonadetes bacterium]|jgi:hypothetical protein|nr:hypothetical protein [Gemmatimonadota bacterium]